MRAKIALFIIALLLACNTTPYPPLPQPPPIIQQVQPVQPIPTQMQEPTPMAVQQPDPTPANIAYVNNVPEVAQVMVVTQPPPIFKTTHIFCLFGTEIPGHYEYRRFGGWLWVDAFCDNLHSGIFHVGYYDNYHRWHGSYWEGRRPYIRQTNITVNNYHAAPGMGATPDESMPGKKLVTKDPPSPSPQGLTRIDTPKPPKEIISAPVAGTVTVAPGADGKAITYLKSQPGGVVIKPAGILVNNTGTPKVETPTRVLPPPPIDRTKRGENTSYKPDTPAQNARVIPPSPVTRYEVRSQAPNPPPPVSRNSSSSPSRSSTPPPPTSRRK